MSVRLVKALVVDDNHSFLEMMKKTLESKGCSVAVASNQGEALSLMLNKPMDIVFIDCILFSGQGMQLVQKIRKYLGFSIDVVMMSGIVSQDSISSYVDTNITGFLHKPISSQNVEKCINKVKERLVFNVENQFLLKIFDEKVKPEYKFKWLLSLEKVTNVEFLLTLIVFLESKESGNILFSTKSKEEHKIFFSKGCITNYSSANLLDHFVEKGFLLEKEAKQFKVVHSESLDDKLVQSCAVSPHQIIDVKLDLLKQSLKKIMSSPSLSFKTELFTQGKQGIQLLFSQDDLAEVIFEIKDDRFDHSLKEVFDEKVLKFSLKFEKDDDITNYHSEAQSLVAKLKTGLRLGSLSLEKDKIYKDLFYILMKGQVSFYGFSDNFKYTYLYERYKCLEKFFQDYDPQTIFHLLGNVPKGHHLDNRKVHEFYLSFIKNNHPDKFLKNLPRDVLKFISGMAEKLKHHHDTITDTKMKQEKIKIDKKEKMKEEISIVRKRQACIALLKKRENKKAFSILKEIPFESIEQDVIWKLVYLWLGLANPDLNYCDKQKIKKYLPDVVQNEEAKSNSIYYYILGLFHESKKDYKKALLSYESAKTLEPSFELTYEAIKRITFMDLEKKDHLSSFKKMYEDFFKPKRKKTG